MWPCDRYCVRESHDTASGRFQGHRKDAKRTLRKRGGRSLDLAVEKIEVADTNAKNDAVVRTMEMNATNKTQFSAYRTSGGFTGGVRCSCYAETLSTVANSLPDHDFIDVTFFSCSTNICLRRRFSSSPLKIISIERS